MLRLIWTLIKIVIYLAVIVGFVAFVALFWGLSRLSLDYSADILWLVPVALILILGVYLLARIGQQMTLSQVKQLKNFVETTLKE